MLHQTELPSRFDHLEKMTITEILQGINHEDKLLPSIIEKCIPQIEAFIHAFLSNYSEQSRLFYIGAGTSGRLGVLDAAECPPTFGVQKNKVIGIIAGEDIALKEAVEQVEDDENKGWLDLLRYHVNPVDMVIGLSASGTTPYVLGAIDFCNKNNIATGCITSNVNSLLAEKAKFPITPETGAEFITGSTRMKAGTAEKLILNMISSSIMIKLGHIKGNKMIDLQLTNNKLIDRGTRIIMEELNISYKQAKELLLKKGSVRNVLEK